MSLKTSAKHTLVCPDLKLPKQPSSLLEPLFSGCFLGIEAILKSLVMNYFTRSEAGGQEAR